GHAVGPCQVCEIEALLTCRNGSRSCFRTTIQGIIPIQCGQMWDRITDGLSRRRAHIMKYSVRCAGCAFESILPAEWIDQLWLCPRCGLNALPQTLARIPPSETARPEKKRSIIPVMSAAILGLTAVAFAGYELGAVLLDAPEPNRQVQKTPVTNQKQSKPS